MAQEIDEHDVERMAASHGDPAWQPKWELLAVFVSVDLWRHCSVALVRTDASAALGVVRGLARRSLPVNNLAAELGLRLQCMGCALQDVHLQSTLNVEADGSESCDPRFFRSSLSATCAPYASAGQE